MNDFVTPDTRVTYLLQVVLLSAPPAVLCVALGVCCFSELQPVTPVGVPASTPEA